MTAAHRCCCCLGHQGHCTLWLCVSAVWLAKWGFPPTLAKWGFPPTLRSGPQAGARGEGLKDRTKHQSARWTTARGPAPLVAGVPEVWCSGGPLQSNGPEARHSGPLEAGLLSSQRGRRGKTCACTKPPVQLPGAVGQETLSVRLPLAAGRGTVYVL
jgi:hypothetical protein